MLTESLAHPLCVDTPSVPGRGKELPGTLLIKILSFISCCYDRIF